MPHQRFRQSVLAAAILAPLTAAALAAGPAPQGGANEASIRFRAVGGDGSPAADLTAGDVTLKVDGRIREVLSLKLVDLRNPTPAPAEAAPPAPASPVPPPFTTNAVGGAAAAGRDVYILVDEESIAPGRDPAVKEAAKLVLAALAPGDRSAVMSVRQGGPNVGLSTDHERVRTAIATLAGYGNSNESVQDLICRTSRTIQTLQGVFNASAGEAPPTVIFFSTAVAALQPGRTTVIGAGRNAASNERAIADLCQLRPEEFQRLGAAAQNANVSFFAVELLDASAAPPQSEASGGLENLGGVTGGDFLRMGGNVEAQMARVGRAMSSYYVVTFAPDASDRSGTKRIELAVARGGVMVRAPKEMSFGKAAAKAVGPHDMIRAAGSFSDLPLRAAGYVSRNPGDNKVRILALFEPTEPGVKLKAAMVGMFDPKGKLTAQWSAQTADLSNPTAMAALVVPDGTYRMRVAATDTSGRSGAVDIHEFQANLIEAGPIKLGDLVLGRMGQSGPVPALQFETDPEAVAIVELYGRPAGPLKMYVEIVVEGGDPIQVPLSPSASSEPDKFLLAATLPIADLKPGDYTVRAVVGVEGHPDAQVTSTLRKVKSGS